MKPIILLGLIFSFSSHADVPINAGMAGTWHNNAIPGQGLFIDVIPANQTLFAGWFTYLPDGSGSSQLYWLTLQGPYSGELAELTLYKTDHGQFNTATEVTQVAVGWGQLIFSSCTEAQFNYQLDEFDVNGSIDLNRITPDVFCEEYTNNNPPVQSPFNYPPEVIAVQTSVHTDHIAINFDLSDPENDRLDIQFLAIDTQGNSYAIPQAFLQGHVGYPVLGGVDKTVLWQHHEDQGFQALNHQTIQIKVVVDDRQYSTLQDIIDAVSTERLVTDIQALEGVRHHQFSANGLAQARNYIREQMNQHPVQIEEQNFNHLGSQGINIIGLLPAVHSTADVYIIDGHYDTVGSTPGADDNATGTAGMLEAMRILSQFNSQQNIKFIAFDKEELGLVGSRYYANNRDPEENISGMINFEMIGYTCTGQAECINFPNADTSIYNIKSSFANILSDTFNQVGTDHVPGLKITPVTDDGDPNFRRSDHAPFWDIGVDALFLTDGANFRTPHYHQATDRLATLDTTFMTQVVKTAVGTLATLADISHTGQAMSEPFNINNP